MHSHSTSISHHALIVLSSIKKRKKEKTTRQVTRESDHRDHQTEKVSVATAIFKQGGVFQHSHNTRRSQSTLKVLSADFRKDALGKTQVKTSIESERREYKAKIGVGLGLQAHFHSTHPNPQSKKAKDKSSHKRNLHKDISTKTSPQTASRVNQKNPMEKISQRSHSRLQTERNISAQPQSKMFSKYSQPTSTRNTKRQVTISIQSEQGEYIGRMGVGLGLGASSLSSRAPKPTKKNAKPRQVTKETQPTQHQVPQMPNPPLQSHTIAHQGQINLYKRGNMSTATTGHSHCPLITLSSLSAAKSTGNRKAPPMS